MLSGRGTPAVKGAWAGAAEEAVGEAGMVGVEGAVVERTRARLVVWANWAAAVTARLAAATPSMAWACAVR